MYLGLCYHWKEGFLVCFLVAVVPVVVWLGFGSSRESSVLVGFYFAVVVGLVAVVEMFS